MTAMAAATLYAGLFGLLLLVLKANVGRVRMREKVIFGDGGKEPLQCAQRAQGNAVEDVPIVVLGLLALGAMAAPVILVHALGASLFAGRILHAIGLGRSTGSSFGRMAGTLISLLAQLVTAGTCLWFALTA